MTLLQKRLTLALLLAILLAGGAAYAWLRWVLIAGLPSTESIKELRLEEPLRIYTADGKLMGEFGAERRAPLDYAELPQGVVQAFLAAEDDRFFEHPGVDWQGLARAAFKLLTTGDKSQGGSTITMQLARNVFLSSERTYTRKAREILLALQIERDLTKEQILELYLNKIFLGNRAYGIGAAAQVYFARDVQDLTLAQTALLAGLPKAPSRDNPTANPERARERRDYVLRRMRELGFISELDYAAAVAEPVATQTERPLADVEAHYVAEMVRAELFARHGEDIYGQGFIVTTSLDSTLQQAANEALRRSLRDYDERHEYRGAEAAVPPEALAEVTPPAPGADQPRALLDAALDARPTVVGLLPAVVIDFAAAPQPRLKVLGRDHRLVEIAGEDLEWAQLKPGALKRGDIVRITRRGAGWRLTQVPQVQGALVALDPHDGAIKALSGGYDFFEGKFNRVIQAHRQPGSGFKPFLYSAALAYGFTPASVILDAPVVFDDPALEDTWRPENYTGKFYGPTRLREALVQSRNLVSIRLLQAIGVPFARNFTSQFGLPADRMPSDLTLALGSASFTPLEMARAYAVFANGGFLVEPYFITEILGRDGAVLFKAQPAVACAECPEARIAEATAVPGATPSADTRGADAAPAQPAAPVTLADGTPLAPRVLDPRLAYLTRDMLRDVVTSGTGAKARELGRNDLAGKTGTTNEEADAWFNGFSSRMVAISWVGFDQPKPLGRGEVGGRAALPMWMDFMAVALKDQKEQWPERPPGLVSVRINPENGNLAAAGDAEAVFEVVQAEHVPPPDAEAPAEGEAGQGNVEDLY